MRIPKQINILGQQYAVIFKPKVTDDDGNVCDGHCDLQKKTIELNKFLAKEERLQVFLHECFHCVLWEAGISRSLDTTLEECTVDSISRWLHRTFTIKLGKQNGTKQKSSGA